MSETTHRASTMAAQLRAAFDGSFVEGRAPEAPPHIDVLVIRVADQGYAMRLSEVLAVVADRPIVRAPSPSPELLGLVGVRGQVVPVYDLRRLLGYASGPPPRWLALVRAAARFGLAFEVFESYLRLPASDVVVSPPRAGGSEPFASSSIITPQGPRPLVDLLALFSTVLGRSSRDHGPSQHDRAQ
ncbi:MAG TPA: chemotaxis protein CheW [Polyangiaceae bacterium]|nr:chemotaxis protein CheW [Polyangiaceae bacterium]